MKTHIRVVFVLMAVLLVAHPLTTHAQTNSSPALDTLISQVDSLRARLHTILSDATPTPALELPLESGKLPTASVQQAAPAAAPVSIPTCDETIITRTLIYGVRGREVEILQKILSADDSEYTAGITGYFGPSTRAAVIRFQAKYGIATSSDGTVGPRTRAFISSHCATTTQTYIGVEGKEHTTPRTTFWTPFKKVLQWFVNTESTSTIETPSVTSFVGPASLIIGQMGEWNVVAVDPAGNDLSYEVNWGDAAPSDGATLAQMAGGTRTTHSSSPITIQHTYAKAGTYTITIAVRTAKGLSGQASATITILNVVAPQVKSDNNVCTADAMQCSDGSWVGRSGSNCTFACGSSAMSTTTANISELPGYAATIGTACSPKNAKLTVFIAQGTKVGGENGWIALTEGTGTLSCQQSIWTDLNISAL